MKFIIEQVAIYPHNVEEALKLLVDMEATAWTTDMVTARGDVFGEPGTNVARLMFNYDLIAGNEFEILEYLSGDNWVENGESYGQDRIGSVCHFGMHCTKEELKQWRAFFADRDIGVAQEVRTSSHTNPAIKDTRRYQYVIFDTKDTLGVDLKFIVRLDAVSKDD